MGSACFTGRQLVSVLRSSLRSRPPSPDAGFPLEVARGFFLRRCFLLSSVLLTLVVAAILIQTAVFSTTIYLHRTATHKALVLHPAVEWAFKFALWLTTGLSTREWVAVHRKHHAFTDEEGDPHSPALEGFWNVQLGNVFYYVRELKNSDVVERYARDIKEGWWDRCVFRRGLLGLTVGTVALCFVIGLWPGLIPMTKQS